MRSILFRSARMVSKEIKISVRQVLPNQQIEQALPDGSKILVLGGLEEFCILRPGADSATKERYYGEQTLLIHTSETSGILFQPYQEKNVSANTLVTDDGTVQSWEETITVHLLMPGEAEQLSEPGPWTIFGGKGVIYVRDRRANSGPDVPRDQFTVHQGDKTTIYEPMPPVNWQPAEIDAAV